MRQQKYYRRERKYNRNEWKNEEGEPHKNEEEIPPSGKGEGKVGRVRNKDTEMKRSLAKRGKARVTL